MMMFLTNYNDGYCGGYMGGGFGWHWIIPIILIGLTIFVIFSLTSTNKNSSTNHSNHALDELNKKFVNGEISEEDYLRRKDLIKKK